MTAPAHFHAETVRADTAPSHDDGVQSEPETWGR